MARQKDVPQTLVVHYNQSKGLFSIGSYNTNQKSPNHTIRAIISKIKWMVSAFKAGKCVKSVNHVVNLTSLTGALIGTNFTGWADSDITYNVPNLAQARILKSQLVTQWENTLSGNGSTYRYVGDPTYAKRAWTGGKSMTWDRPLPKDPSIILDMINSFADLLEANGYICRVGLQIRTTVNQAVSNPRIIYNYNINSATGLPEPKLITRKIEIFEALCSAYGAPF